MLLTFLLLPQQSQAQSISDFNPVSHWTCDESSGVRYDSNTTNSNDLTDNNTVLAGVGLAGNACDFEASNSEYLSITDASQLYLDYQTQFALSAWIKLESSPTNPSPFGIIGKRDPASNPLYSYQTLINASNFYFEVYQSAEDSFGTAWTPSTATWYHLVFTWNGTTKRYRMFVNGTLQGTTQTGTNVGTIQNTVTDFFMGRVNTSGYYFDGLMDEITIFNSDLATSTVTTLYNSGVPLCYDCVASSSPTATSTSANMSDTNFLLVVVIFFLMFIFLGFAFSPLNRKK